jgi:hypothetical protein
MIARTHFGSAWIAVALLLLLWKASDASEFVAVFHGPTGGDGSQQFYAVMSNGDVYGALVPGSCPSTATWRVEHNIYALAGRPQGHIAGAVMTGLGPGFWAVDLNGDIYDDTTYPNFHGNAFAMAGRPASQIVLFSGVGSGYMNLVSTDGALFQFSGNPCAEVRWVGSVPLKPTPAFRPSWGQLKVRYR